MMNIVHYIPEITKHDIVSDELLTIVNAMRDKADVRLVVGSGNHKELFKEGKPDLIHFHGCWDYHTARFVGEANRKGVATVVSTHGGYMPYTFKHEQPMSKLAKMLTYQTHCITIADAVAANTQEELDNIISQTSQTCIELIPSFILDSKTTVESVVDRLVSLYRKVEDTRYRLMMTKLEKDVIRRLVHIGSSRAEFVSKSTSLSIAGYEAMSQEQWKRIMLYANDEHIEDIIGKGAAYENVVIPPVDVDAISRFHVAKAKNDGIDYISEISKKRKNLKHDVVANTEKDEDALRHIIYLAAEISMEAKDKTVSMRHFVSFFRMLQNEDYDEDKLIELLSQAKLKKPTQRILYILKEDLQLSEGFLPIEPVYDSKTQLLRDLINLS